MSLSLSWSSFISRFCIKAPPSMCLIRKLSEENINCLFFKHKSLINVPIPDTKGWNKKSQVWEQPHGRHHTENSNKFFRYLNIFLFSFYKFIFGDLWKYSRKCFLEMKQTDMWHLQANSFTSKLNKHFEGSCELFSLNLVLILTSCWWISNCVQTLCNQCSNFLRSVSKLCANIDTQTKTLPVAHLELLS